jgi:hypothetical protein
MYPWRRGRRSRRGPGSRHAPPRRPTVPRARGMERTPPAAPRERGPRRRGTSGAVGAARAGDPDVVRIVARRFYRGANADAVRARSRGERTPARATPSDPTLRSRHMRVPARAHPGAGVIDVRGTRPAGRTSRWSVAERVGAARGGGLIAVMPPRRFYPGASDRTHGLGRCAGEGDRHTPTRPAGPPDPSHDRRAERANTAASRSVGPASTRGPRRHRRFRARRRRHDHELAPPEAHDEGGAPSPAAVRARGGGEEGSIATRADGGEAHAFYAGTLARGRRRCAHPRWPTLFCARFTKGGERGGVLAENAKTTADVRGGLRASPRGPSWPPSPRRPRRGAHVPGAPRRGRHPRLCLVRPGQFGRLRPN